MKTYFRIIFSFRGWIIQYKNGLNGSWTDTTIPEQNTVTCFSEKCDAEEVLKNLKCGHSYDRWFDDPSEKGTFPAHEMNGQTA